jgi:hypothetical protein
MVSNHRVFALPMIRSHFDLPVSADSSLALFIRYRGKIQHGHRFSCRRPQQGGVQAIDTRAVFPLPGHVKIPQDFFSRNAAIHATKSPSLRRRSTGTKRSATLAARIPVMWKTPVTQIFPASPNHERVAHAVDNIAQRFFRFAEFANRLLCP